MPRPVVSTWPAKRRARPLRRATARRRPGSREIAATRAATGKSPRLHIEFPSAVLRLVARNPYGSSLIPLPFPSGANSGEPRHLVFLNLAALLGAACPFEEEAAWRTRLRCGDWCSHHRSRQQGARADDITDWNCPCCAQVSWRTAAAQHDLRTRSPKRRSDAVNGIDRRYTPILVARDLVGALRAGRRPHRRRSSSSKLYKLGGVFTPNQQPPRRNGGQHRSSTSRPTTAPHRLCRPCRYIAIKLRPTDGFNTAPPTFTGSTAIGQWRPTPNAPYPGTSRSAPVRALFEHDALGYRLAIAIPPGRSPTAHQRAIRERLQRDQDDGQPDERRAEQRIRRSIPSSGPPVLATYLVEQHRALAHRCAGRTPRR